MYLNLKGNLAPSSMVLPLPRGQWLGRLAEEISHLTLTNVRIGQSGYELHDWIACLASFMILELKECDVAAGIFALVASHPSTRLLVERKCVNITAEAWLGLAVARTSPMKLMVRPPLAANIVDNCTRVSQQRHGATLITFL